MVIGQSRRSRVRLVLVLAVALGIAGAAAAQTSGNGAKNFLWKVQSGSGVLYIAGSVHALTADAYPLAPAFQRAFDASGTLVEEIDLGDSSTLAAAPMMIAKGVYQDGRTFEGVVSSETAAMVKARLGGTIPAELLKPMKPWMVTLMLTAIEVQRAGLDTSLGLDKHFYDKAVAVRKNVSGLETAESQIDRFDKMPEPLQEQMLRSTLADLDTQNTELQTLVRAWQRGDVATIEKTLLHSFDGYPAAYTSLIVERNRNWLPQLDACLARSSPCFVIVGAAHLVGPDGLLIMLQKKGYKVEQQ
jgi:uncharacterized protein YbaP (TraB family)